MPWPVLSHIPEYDGATNAGGKHCTVEIPLKANNPVVSLRFNLSVPFDSAISK